MTARSTMARLIQTVRDFTFAGTAEYTQGTANYWDDDHIQAILDRHSMNIWHEPLRPITRYRAGGSVAWFEYQSDHGEWEATLDGTTPFYVQDSLGAIQGTSGYSVDYQLGLLTFTANRAGSAYFVTGVIYDQYGAAAELLRAWAARWGRQFDFSVNQEKYSRSQAAKEMREQAAQYEMRAWPNFGSLVRSDVQPDPNEYEGQTGYTGGAAHAARSAE